MKAPNIKVITASALLVFLSISSYSQTKATPNKSATKKLDKNKVPKVVTESFIADYPSFDYDYWYGYPSFDYANDWYDYDPFFYNNDNPSTYVVEFSKAKVPYKAVYTSAGKKVAIHKSVSAIPSAISTSIIHGPYKTWMVGKDKEEIFKDTDKDQLKVYKVSVTKGTQKHALYFQPDGKLLKDTKLS